MDRRWPRSHAGSGASLIEVLIASLLLAIGLVSFALTQGAAVVRSADAISLFQAELLADHWITLSRVYGGQAVSSSQYTDWQAQVAQQLPSGQGEVESGAEGTAIVRIQWESGDRRPSVVYEQPFLP